MNEHKDNNADVPADPNSSVQAGRSDIPDESKASIEATTATLQHNSNQASDENYQFSDSIFDSFEQIEDDWSVEDSFEQIEDNWDDDENDEKEGNTKSPEIIHQNHVSDDPSAATQDRMSDKPPESMATIDVTRVPMQYTPPEASFTTIFELIKGDTFFDSSEEITESGVNCEEDNDCGDNSENDETTVTIKMTDGNNINSTLRINNESTVGHNIKRNKSSIFVNKTQATKLESSTDSLNNRIGTGHADFENVTEKPQTNNNEDPNSNRPKDDVELKNKSLKAYELSTELQNHTGSH